MVSARGEFPSAEEVSNFHTLADTDTRDEAIHHTLGQGHFQAARGDDPRFGNSGTPPTTLPTSVLTKRGVATTQTFTTAGADQAVVWDVNVLSTSYFSFAAPGTFTCLIAGTYCINVSLGIGQGTSAQGWMAARILVKGSIYAEGLSDRDTPGGRSVLATTHAVLAVGDTVSVVAASRFAESGVVNTPSRTYIELVPVT